MLRLSRFVAIAIVLLATAPAMAQGVWRRGKTISLADITAAETTVTATVFTVPGTSSDTYYVDEVVLERVTDFATALTHDGGVQVTTAAVSIGSGSVLTKYIAASNVFTGAKATAKYTIGSATSGPKPGNLEPGGTPIIATFVVDTTVDKLAAGKFSVLIHLSPIPKKNTL